MALLYRSVWMPKVTISLILVVVSQILISQPVVVTNPSDTSVCVESSAGFSIIAVNTTGYQWQENDGVGWYNLDESFTYANGEYTPNLTIIDANLALNGYLYRCVVVDLFNDKDTSLPALLGVYDPPIITYDPASQRVCKGNIADFTVEAINGSQYLWQEYNDVGWIDIEDNAFYGGSQTPDLNVYTVLGMNGFSYRCIVTNVSCPDTSLAAVLNVDPTPIVFGVLGGGEYCEGGQGLNIELNGSEMGISYNLLINGEGTGVVVEGTGQSIDFGLQQAEGVYTVIGYNQFTSCSIEMNENASIIINPLPLDNPLQGGGTICMGEEYPNVFLLNSEIGIIYYLYHNSQFTGNAISGTGYGLSFGEQQEAGFYTVVAENSITGCTSQMSGISEINILELPVADAGSDHNIIQGSSVQLQGSASGGSGNYNYLWSPSNLCVSSSTSSTQTNNLYISTIFSLEVTDNVVGCVSNPDTSIVYVGSGPLSVQAFSSNNNICSGESISLIAVAGGGTGNYSYSWTSSPPGFSSTIPNPQISPVSSALYFVQLSDGLETITDTVSVTVFPLPQSYTINNGGNYCSGGQGVEISLDGSETGLLYSLYYQQSIVDNMIGNGQQLVFGNFTQQGEYNIIAKNDNTGCMKPQNGVATIGVYELPVAEAGSNSLINAGSFATLSGSVTGGAGGYSYLWSPSDSLINSTSATPSTIPLYNTNMFNLTVTDNQGCESQEDNAIVFVSGGQIALSILTSGYPICPGDEVQLYAMASGGSGSFSYFWQSNPTGTSSTSFDPIVNPLVTTTYIVTVSDGLTVITDSVTVIVTLSPTVFMLTGGGVVCEGTDPSNIILQGSETGVDYQLLQDGAVTGMTISGTGFALDFGIWNTNGNYTSFATNSSSLCNNSMLGNAIVTVNPLPISSAGPDQLLTAGTTATLNGSAEGGSGSYNYQWQPSYLCVSPMSQNTFTQPISQTTMFSLIASDIQTQCLSLPDTVILFAQGNDLYATATATPGSLCSGSELTLSAMAGGGTGNYSYSWFSLPMGFYSSLANPTTYLLVSTTYYLDVFDGLSHAYDTISIEVLSLPVTYQVTGGGSYCEGGDGLSIGLSGSEIGVIYSLFRSPNEFIEELSGTGQPLDFGVFTQGGNYYSTSVANVYCEETMLGESIITVNPNPIAQAGENKAIQFNEQTVLLGEAHSGSGNYGFMWTPTDSLINANIQQPLTVPLGSTTMFNLLVNDNTTGCNSSEDNTVVFVSGGPFTLQLINSIPSVCSGEETQLFTLASGGTGNYTYLWTSNPPGFVSTLYNPVVSPNVSTVYSVSVSDGNSIINDFISITVNPLPLSYFLTGGGEVCLGDQSDEIILQNSEINTTYSLLMDGINTGVNKSGTGFSLDFGVQSQNGQYSIFATENTTLCTNYMAGDISVVINPLPEADAGSDVIIPVNTTTVLSGSVTGSSGGYSYSWEPTVLCQNSHAQTTLTNPIPQTTLFKFEATDLQTQCISLVDTVIVFTNSDNLFVEASSSLLSICNFQPINLLALAGGGTGSYSYSWTSYPSGFVSSEMNPIAYPGQSTMYYVDVFDGLGYAMDSVYVHVSQSPMIFTLTGGGNYCFGENGVEIGLNGSESGLLYRLFHFPDNPVVDVIGTGAELSFGSYTEQGDYFVVANADMTCNEQMNGTATVVVDQLPQANAGDDKYVIWSNQVVLNGSALGGSGTYFYSWAPSDSVVNPTNSEPLTIPIHATTLFNLNTVDAETGCVGTDDQAVVFVSGGPLVLDAYASVDNICQGEQSQLFALTSGGSGNFTYLWLSNPAGFSSTSYNPVVQPNITTTYTVIVNDGSNTITDSVIINVNPSPGLYSVFGGGLYCDGNNGVEILLDGSDVVVVYELYNESGSTGIVISGYGDTINFGHQTNEGYYWAIGLNNNNGCQNVMEDTVQVTMADSPIADAGLDHYIDIGTSTQLYGDASSGSGYYNFNWYPDYLLVNPGVQNPVTTILNETTLFILAVDDANTGCISNTDSVIIYIVNMPLTVTVSATPVQLCEGGETYLSALAGGGTGNYSYSWYSNPTCFYSNNPFPHAYPEESTTYIVEISDGETIIIDSIFVVVTPAPYTFEILGGGNYCKDGNGINISLSGSQEFVEYTLYWNQNVEVMKLIGDGLPLDFGETKIEGNYTVLASNSETDCLSQMAGIVVVSQFPQPIAEAGTDISISSGSHVTLNGNASGGLGVYSYLWIPPEKLLNPTDPDATTVALNQTTMFSLQVEDVTSGCASDPSNMIVFISGGPLLVNLVVSNNQICPGEQLSIYALPGGGSGNYSYFWESSPPGFNATSSEIIVNPGETTWYKVSISDGDEVVTDSVLITMFPLPESYALLGGGGYCSGYGGVEVYLENSTSSTIYTLFHNAVSTGYYVFGTGSQISFGNIITEGNYSVIAENGNGCSSLMNNVVQVSVDPKPIKFQLYGGGTYCENDPTLGILLESSELQTDYELYKDAVPTSIVNQGSGLPLSFNGFIGTGNYSVVATGAETGCTNSMSGVAGLIINDKPDIVIYGDNSLCSGDSILLSGSGGYTYEWNTAPPQYTPSIVVSPSETNSYTLTGYNIKACSDTATHIVDVYDKPVVTLFNDPILLSIICYPDNLFNYDFYMGDVLIQDGPENSWYYGDMGIISDTIVVVAKTESGCSDEEYIFVEMKEPPNAFTPNGDGKNDIFLEGHDITVFSSWGGEIYKGNTGWDGKHNGSLVVPGTYFYIHNIYNIDGSIIKTIKGSVTVVIE